ncbi:acyl-CoA dehydrogenase family protein [Hoyosella rhizosphaerae]|uniref:Acyl-CoA dehydrogenase n=1 Tax=Hoyosella rhizosphaerae TaxID=1755582 RepID=A0A916U2J5_9ACTN|nr:acyl-CoA dehydrogenase family protein [Hoyosella rhizosphaerae]MBN4926687.1 acyl-CoA dehydrogenase family protein [Hoyosella rhizosphaerae]GGC57188.1 acyl-CoA dehydrogenase [Hoyosella rhizosphaerae]
MFTLTADDQAILDTVQQFAHEEIEPYALDWDQRKHFPVDVLRRAATLGMGAICVREDVGGSGLTRLDSVRIFEHLAHGCPTIAAYVSIHNMVASMIDTYGTEAQRRDWLPPLATMDSLASYCLTEPNSGSDAAALTTSARRDGDELVINGVKQFISGAGVSSTYVVMARTGGAGPHGISAVLVPGSAAGLSFGANETKMGWNAMPTRQVMFDNVRVPATNILGGENNGFRIAMNGLNGGRLNIAACSLGGAQAALDKAVHYVNERSAFGQKLSQRETVQSTIAGMRIDLEASRSILWRAAEALDDDSKDKIALCAMAKSFVTEAGFRVADEALQLHGGYGYLADYGIEKIVRDLRVHKILEGTNEIMRMVVARSTLNVT